MKGFLLIIIAFILPVIQPLCAQEESISPGAVVLDIGHQQTAKGAQSPDRRINEFDFWLKYAGYVKKEVEAAGFPCIITNRSTPPGNKSAGDIIYLNKPDKNGKRYSSTHHPEHIGAGMISADYAIDIKARCVVFLHLNCTTSKWSSKPPTGLVIYNRNQGKELAETVCRALRETLLDKPGGISNAKRGVKAIPRFIGSQPSAGWMNTLDEEKIPAIVFEALYLNSKSHVDFLAKETNAVRLAEVIGSAIVEWLKQGGEIERYRECP